MADAARQKHSFQDYLRIEEESATVKHEFLDGAVWAMAGGSPDHAAIAANITIMFGSQLRDRPCRVYSSDLRIRVEATGLGTYPDVTVVYDELVLDAEDNKGHTAVNPRVLVEVLSPSTEEYDRGEKLEHYKQIASLDAVLLVAQESHRVELVQRHDNDWVTTTHESGAVEIASLSCSLPLDEIYRDPLAP